MSQNSPQRKLSKRKSDWKLRVKAALGHARLRFALVRSGVDEDQGEFYDIARRIAGLGRLGERVLRDAHALDMHDRMILDIEWRLLALSNVSGKFYDLAAQRRWPTTALPTYTAPAEVREHFPEVGFGKEEEEAT